MQFCALCYEYTKFECPLCGHAFCKDDNEENCYTIHRCEMNHHRAIITKITPTCPKCNGSLSAFCEISECLYCGLEMCDYCLNYHLKLCQCDHCISNLPSKMFDPCRATCVNKLEEFQENHPKNWELKMENMPDDGGVGITYYFIYVEKFKKEKLEAECEQLKQEIIELKEIITEYELMPPIENGGGIEYQKTKRHFEEIQ